MNRGAGYMWQERFIQWWWIQLPLRVARFFPGLGNGLSDGVYLVRWAPVAAVAPPISLLLGILWGAAHSGDTFTHSLPLMALAIGVALMSAQLGGWMLAGYVIGDFLIHEHSAYGLNAFQTLIQVRLPLLLAYYLLGWLTVGIPLLGLSARVQVKSLRLPDRFRPVIEAVVYAVIIGALAYAWASAVAVLIRPVFTWRGGQPPVEAIRPLQEDVWFLVGAAAIIAVARVVLEERASSLPVFSWAQVLSFAFPIVAAQSKRFDLRGPARAVAGAAGLTFLMAGLISGIVEVVLVFLFLTLLLWVRDQMRQAAWPWLQLLESVPVILRFAVGLILSYLISQPIVAALWNSTQTFTPVLIATCLSAALLSLLTVVREPGRIDLSEHALAPS